MISIVLEIETQYSILKFQKFSPWIPVLYFPSYLYSQLKNYFTILNWPNCQIKKETVIFRGLFLLETNHYTCKIFNKFQFIKI